MIEDIERLYMGLLDAEYDPSLPEEERDALAVVRLAILDRMESMEEEHESVRVWSDTE